MVTVQLQGTVIGKKFTDDRYMLSWSGYEVDIYPMGWVDAAQEAKRVVAENEPVVWVDTLCLN